MSKKTDGRSWLTVRSRKFITNYHGALSKMVKLELTKPDSPELTNATAAYIEASQALCSHVLEQQASIRSLTNSLSYTRRHRFRDP